MRENLRYNFQMISQKRNQMDPYYNISKKRKEKKTLMLFRDKVYNNSACLKINVKLW